jgi:hypothetical protein
LSIAVFGCRVGRHVSAGSTLTGAQRHFGDISVRRWLHARGLLFAQQLSPNLIARGFSPRGRDTAVFVQHGRESLRTQRLLVRSPIGVRRNDTTVSGCALSSRGSLPEVPTPARAARLQGSTIHERV